jgi:hypothetical protein
MVQLQPRCDGVYRVGMRTDAEAVADAIRGVALCAMCLARKIGVAPMRAVSALALAGQRTPITDAVAQCATCKERKSTHRI